ncbi:MAG: ABC-F family ATP-binding cassette domain-containing protein [Chelatococcus sp.]|uniref:ABC-F family ATP-binding cassette domain-containing protein n=1 Tax=Chelatococcus sp. TaxID=1953771 RepID=UPI0025C59328|nr:ABC-F family ATP-binding cassette domain-containing protein [Chelatococcus sp.]MBX3539962.1 ABC-F family ATP-binding cassette domain-containing protein [Chelatococcus sp.]
MPASITLLNLSCHAPDGAPLFSDLNLSFGPERTGIVGRNGTGKTTLLRLIAGELRPSSGSIQASGALGVMRQDVQASADTLADLFDAKAALAILDRAERGLAEPDELAGADWDLPARIDAALLRCGLLLEPHARLAALSGGQRTRAALAALIFAEPDILLLDEPTNNLDRDGRRAVLDFISGWRGGAVIVSHDRELLDAVDAIVELTTLGATRYGGNYRAYRARKTTELEGAHNDLAAAERARAEVRRRAQQAVERKARRDSNGQKGRARGDQPKILMDAARGRAEASGGSNARLREARAGMAEGALADARARIEVLQPLRMDMLSTGIPLGRTALRLDSVTGGYAIDRPVIRDLSLTLTGPERVAITGPNGSGKSTLLALVAGQLEPWSGAIDRPVPLAFLDQDVSLLAHDLSLRENFLHLNPEADENQCRAALARFRFRAEDAQQRVGSLSGGERLRAGLACTLGRPVPPALLVLDEPTNHLDLDGIEALETALCAFDGALLVVSHDERFLDGLALGRRVELDGIPG